MVRKGKNSYLWRGPEMVDQTIREIAAHPLPVKPLQEPELGRKGKSLEVLSLGFLNLFINWRK